MSLNIYYYPNILLYCIYNELYDIRISSYSSVILCIDVQILQKEIR